VGLALVSAEDEVMLMTNRGQTIRTRVAEIRETGRNAQGVKVMNVDVDERVVAIEPVGEREDEDADEEATDEPAEGGAAQAAEGSETAADEDSDAGDSPAEDGETEDATDDGGEEDE
jgi:DNA gyrase subunit A